MKGIMYHSGAADTEKDLLVRPQETPLPEKITKYHDPHTPQAERKEISFPVAVCFAVNFIMGSGFLTVPWAVSHAGVVFSLLLLFGTTWICRTTAGYLLEVMARAEAITRHRYLSLGPDDVPRFVLSHRKFEVVELVEMFLGRIMKVVYLIAVSLYLYGTVWSYTAVFANAFASHVSLGFIESHNGTYLFFVAIFAVVALGLACLDIKEQAIVQLIMTGVRIGIIIIMIATTADAMTTGVPGPFDTPTDPVSKHYHERDEDATFVFFGPAFSAVAVAQLIPIAIYSQLFHAGVPVISQPVRNKERTLSVFSLTLLITTVVYSILSGFLAFYFGDHLDPEGCNQNWVHYSGSSFKDGLSYLVVLFPAFDVVSVAPLNIMTLASNVMSAVYGERVAKKEESRKLTIAYRMLAGVPPIIGACIIHNLSKVVDYTGLIGLVIAFILPALLWEVSLKHCHLEWPHITLPKSPYATIMSRKWPARVVFGLGVVFIIFAFLGLVGAYN